MTSIEPTVLSSKRVVYVGGLAEEATVPIVRAFFVPFGNIKSVDIPMDYKEGKNKGFCFVEFEDADDAAEAIFNSDGSEVLGKTIKCNLAQANQVHQISSNKEAVWNQEEWYEKYVAGHDQEAERKQEQQVADTGTLQL